MEITLMDIKYVWSIDTISQNGIVLEKLFNLTGYDITFLINKEIEGKIHLDTDKEKNVEELKTEILSQIFWGNISSSEFVKGDGVKKQPTPPSPK